MISYVILVVHLQTKIPHLLLQILPLHLHTDTQFACKEVTNKKQDININKEIDAIKTDSSVGCFLYKIANNLTIKRWQQRFKSSSDSDL